MSIVLPFDTPPEYITDVQPLIPAHVDVGEGWNLLTLVKEVCPLAAPRQLATIAGGADGPPPPGRFPRPTRRGTHRGEYAPEREAGSR